MSGYIDNKGVMRILREVSATSELSENLRCVVDRLREKVTSSVTAHFLVSDLPNKTLVSLWVDRHTEKCIHGEFT